MIIVELIYNGTSNKKLDLFVPNLLITSSLTLANFFLQAAYS